MAIVLQASVGGIKLMPGRDRLFDMTLSAT
jgi:hypothetical protein